MWVVGVLILVVCGDFLCESCTFLLLFNVIQHSSNTTVCWKLEVVTLGAFVNLIHWTENIICACPLLINGLSEKAFLAFFLSDLVSFQESTVLDLQCLFCLKSDCGLLQFVCADVNMVIIRWCGWKQLDRDPWSQFSSKQIVKRFIYSMNAIWPNYQIYLAS